MKKLFYECLNQDCDSRETKLRTFKTSTGTISKVTTDSSFCFEKEDEDDKPEYCPYCDVALKVIGESNPVFLGTSLLSSSQKQQMLMNRSKKHERTSERMDNRSDILSKNRQEYGGK